MLHHVQGRRGQVRHGVRPLLARSLASFHFVYHGVVSPLWTPHNSKESPCSRLPFHALIGLFPPLLGCAGAVRCAPIDNLYKDTSVGSDGIHPVLLKSCKNRLAHPILLIFTRSLNIRQVPSAWKSSHIIPYSRKACTQTL